MSGIVFLRTKDLNSVIDFYVSTIGATVWLDQRVCIIVKHGNLLLGFCQSETSDTELMITFFYPHKAEVDKMYQNLKEIADTKPAENRKFHIYHFFAKDPEGRALEFQSFLHPLQPYADSIDILQNRRSIREYQIIPVSDKVLSSIFEVCRFSPTSRNSQSYSFVVIKDKKTLDYLASVRGSSSEPIQKAPLAVAVVSDPDKSGAYIQDGCIAAYHFMLACKSYGLGTCWIADMDRPAVKEVLSIPEKHYVVTITPVGYPRAVPEAPSRRKAEEMVTIFRG
jgi:nitroreductase